MHPTLTYAALTVAVLAASNSAVSAQETDHHLAARAELADEVAEIQKQFGDAIDVSLDGYDHELVAREIDDDIDDEDDTDLNLVQRDVEDDEDAGFDDDVDFSLSGYDHKLVARDQGVEHSDEVDHSLEGYDHELVARDAQDEDEEHDVANHDLNARDAAAQDTGILSGAVPKNILKKLGRMRAHNVVQYAKRSDEDDEEEDDANDLEARDAAAPAAILKKLQRLKPHHVVPSKRSDGEDDDTAELEARDAALPANILKKLDRLRPKYVQYSKRSEHAEGNDEDDDEDFETQDGPQGYDHSQFKLEETETKEELVTRTVGEEKEEARSWLNVKRWF